MRLFPSVPLTPIAVCLGILGLGSSVLLSSCGSNPFAQWLRPLSPTPAPQASGNDLTFKDITLDQVSPAGEKVWSLKAARVSYANKTKLAMLEKPSGILFRGGKPTYQVSGTTGTINESASELTLQGNVLLKLLTENGQVTGEKLAWTPQEARFVLEGNLKGHYDTLIFAGQRAELQDRQKHLLLSQGVEADLTQSQIRLRTEALEWNMTQQVVEGKVPVVLEHYAAKDPAQIVDRATGGGIQGDLKTRQLRLSPDAVVNLGRSNLTVRSQTLLWDTIAEVIRSDTPLSLTTDNGNQIQGDRGNFDLKAQIVTLDGSIQGHQTNPVGQLWADRVQWAIEGDRLEASGNVRYEQPSTGFHIEGNEAIGHLNSQEIQVTGSSRVKTVYTLP